MNNILKYKNYWSKIEYSADDGVLYGRIEGISDLVNFESPSAEEIETEFHKAVDDYLEFCSEMDKEPDKAFRGNFNVRISPELHRKMALVAIENNKSLNQMVEIAISDYIETYEKIQNFDFNAVFNEFFTSINQVSEQIAEGVKKAWEKAPSPSKNIPFTHKENKLFTM